MIKKTVLSVVLFAISIVIAEGASEPNRPTATELLDRFAATQEVFNSFTAKTENRVELTQKARGPKYGHINRLSYEDIDFRFDLKNRKCSRRTKLYGNVLPVTPNVPKDNPQYTSSLKIENQFSRWYGRQNMTTDAGRVNVSKNSLQPKEIEMGLSRGYKGHEAIGYLYGSDERFDVIFQNASDVHVQENMETVGQYSCYVIEAVTPSGCFKVWLAPDFGYNIARARVILKEGDKHYGTSVAKGARYSASVDHVKFGRIDGIWLPVEAEIEYVFKVPGRYDSHEKVFHNVAAYQLNPDHEAIGSFAEDDIQNGAKVSVIEGQNVFQDVSVWQDGKMVKREQEK